jgi:hypothetical protein
MTPAVRQKDTWVIFDYSGTLSVEAPLYGSEENIEAQLERTGLKGLGVESPKFFWEKIINTTWHTGSTTPVGYKQVMKDKIKERTAKASREFTESTIAAAVNLFVDDYLGHSRIDSRWQPILKTLHETPYVRTIIATDHYAEATEIIIGFLHQWDIPAFRPREAIAANLGREALIVANSADLGGHKSDRSFWTSLKTTLKSDDVHRILLIDDFGYNEQMADDYARRDAIEKRKAATVHLLQETFPAEVSAIPFFLNLSAPAPDKDEYCGRLIEKTSAIINNFLLKRDESRFPFRK